MFVLKLEQTNEAYNSELGILFSSGSQHQSKRARLLLLLLVLSSVIKLPPTVFSTFFVFSDVEGHNTMNSAKNNRTVSRALLKKGTTLCIMGQNY